MTVESDDKAGIEPTDKEKAESDERARRGREAEALLEEIFGEPRGESKEKPKWD